MKKNVTEIVFILDRSGSMTDLVNDTIGGFNSFVEKQKNENKNSKLTTVLFDTEYDVLHDGLGIANVPELTKKEYFARGGTALLDAIGKTINVVENRLKKNKSKVIFVITTDGQENSSHEYRNDKIKEMIEKKTKDGWEFLFLGANIDSFSVSSSLGIDKWSNYSSTSRGTSSLFSTVADVTVNYGTYGQVNDDWAKDIE